MSSEETQSSAKMPSHLPASTLTPMINLLGPFLLPSCDAIKPEPTETLLEGVDIVGLYFSGLWCPPCHQYLPNLVRFYNAMRERECEDKGTARFQIVLVSGDRNHEVFRNHYNDMPWLAIPWADVELVETETAGSGIISTKKPLSSTSPSIPSLLYRRFQITGIPSLVLLDARTGGVLCFQGRERVLKDPEGLLFPWTIAKDLGHDFVQFDPREGVIKDVRKEDIGEKIVLLFFGAKWSDQSIQFCEKLKAFYHNLRAKTKGVEDFEVVYVPSDNCSDDFESFLQTMPFLAIPWTDDSRKQLLDDRFKIDGVPSLLIVDVKSSTVISRNGRLRIENDPNGDDFPYYPNLVEDLSLTCESYGMDINSATSLVAFLEECSIVDQEIAHKGLMAHAQTYKPRYGIATPPQILFFEAFKPSRIGTVVREKTGLGKAQPNKGSLVLLSLQEGGSYFLCDETTINEETIGKFLRDYSEKKLERRHLE